MPFTPCCFKNSHLYKHSSRRFALDVFRVEKIFEGKYDGLTGGWTKEYVTYIGLFAFIFYGLHQDYSTTVLKAVHVLYAVIGLAWNFALEGFIPHGWGAP